MCTALCICRLAHLGHLCAAPSCVLENVDVPMPVTKVFIRMSLNKIGKRMKLQNCGGVDNATPRNFSARFLVKNRAE